MQKFLAGDLKLVLGVVAVLLIFPIGVVSHHENFCFGLPLGLYIAPTTRTIGYNILNEAENHPFRWRGIGFYKADDFKKLSELKTFPVQSAKGRFVLSAYRITLYEDKPSDGLTAQGTLRLKIGISGANSGNFVIDRLAIVARGSRRETPDKYGNVWYSGVGWFSEDYTCNPKEYATMNKHYSTILMMPCGGVGPYEPHVPSGAVFIRHEKSEGLSELSILFHLPQTGCNLIQKLNFRVQGSLKEKGKTGQSAYYFVKDVESVQLRFSGKTIYGGADPVTFYKNDCSEELRENDWANTIDGIDYVIISPDICYGDYTCLPKAVKPYERTKSLFVGRCNATNPDASAKTSKNEYRWGRCDGNKEKYPNCTSTAAKSLTSSYSLSEEWNFLGDLVNRTCNDTDPCPQLAPHPDDIGREFYGKKKKIHIGSKKVRAYGVVLGPGTAQAEIWDTRVVHGIVMTFFTFFIMPVNAFVARYYKETWMDVRIMYFRVWYFIHLNGVMWVIGGMVIGLYRQIGHNVIGHSLTKAAKLHRLVGYLCLFLVVVISVTGGFRMKTPSIARLASIVVHWGISTLIYVLCLLNVWLSLKIPASPAASVDTGLIDERLKALPFNLFVGPMILWVTFEIAIHLVMTILQRRTDSQLKLTHARQCIPVPIPVLLEQTRFDAPGSAVRKLLLAVYGGVSLTLTIFMSGIMIFNSSANRALGPMTCSKRLNGTTPVTC